MALSKKIQNSALKQPSVEELIMKGGSSGILEEGKTVEEEEDVRRVQLRVPDAKLEQIDKMVRRRPGKLSRHTWIMEAIEEKLQRDNESN
jgi:hypothetical protein